MREKMKAMNCKRFKKQVPLVLDDYLDTSEQSVLMLHATQCASCQGYLEEMRVLRRNLRQLPRPRVPADFVPRTVAAFDARERQRRLGLWGRLVGVGNWALVHPRTVSAVSSLVITLVSYSVILGHLKPITHFYFPMAAHTEPVTFSHAEFQWLNNQSGPESGYRTVTFPRVETTRQLVASIDQTRKTRFVVLATVHADGKISLVEVLDPPGTREVFEQVQTALQNLSFYPARSDGRPVDTQLVLMVQLVDVSG
jgi:hypothetical protein